MGYINYFFDWYRYSRLPAAEPIHVLHTYPQLHDRQATSVIDAHYFYVNGWAMRRVRASTPKFHVDIASQTIFADLLGALVPVVFLDYRPLVVQLSNLQSMGGNLLQLPFADGSISSLSCLHVVEHIGLGRYGDPLDPAGTKKAVKELVRVLAPGGNLFLATPIGHPRLCFNAHRIHTAAQICQMADELNLVEFSGIDDTGRYLEHISLSTLQDCEYGCGLFWFKRQVAK
jgi:SAM-dependent methyltransferase